MLIGWLDFILLDIKKNDYILSDVMLLQSQALLNKA